MKCAAVLPVFLVLSLLGSTGGSFAAKEEIFRFVDPRGDDHGAGEITYPVRSELGPGDLDLLSFSATPDRGGTSFAVTFARPVRKPERRPVDQLGTTLDRVCRFGFYAFNVDVYIDTDRVPGSGSVNMIPGRLAEVDPAHAWERAVVLTPRPHEARDELKRLAAATVRKEQKEEGKRYRGKELEALQREIGRDVEVRVFFPTRVRVEGSRIRFFVPDSFLGGPARADWSYVVVVTGADHAQSYHALPTLGYREAERGLAVIPVEPGGSPDHFGGGDDDSLGLQPAVIDAIVPEGASQEKLLGDYDPDAGRRAKLPGVSGSATPR